MNYLNIIMGLILCAAGGMIVGRNAKNYIAIIGMVLAQVGIMLLAK